MPGSSMGNVGADVSLVSLIRAMPGVENSVECEIALKVNLAIEMIGAHLLDNELQFQTAQGRRGLQVYQLANTRINCIA